MLNLNDDQSLDVVAWVVYHEQPSERGYTTLHPIYYSTRDKALEALGIQKKEFPNSKIAKCEFYFSSGSPWDIDGRAKFLAMLN